MKTEQIALVSAIAREGSISETYEFAAYQLQDLFLSAEWPLGHFPDKLVVAM